jgi:two-component system OmpR family response regulator
MGDVSSQGALESHRQMGLAVGSDGSNNDKAETSASAAARPPAPGGSGQATILVIDDDQMIRILLHDTLHLHGYHVTAVGTVQEAEGVLQQLGAAALGLVIADIQLTTNRQAREGYVLYERWSATHPTLAFLLISGDPSSQALPAIHTGAVDFLAKPFSMSELLAVVQRLFRP